MEDKKFFIEKGDPGFSPIRNNMIIEEIMAKHEATRKRKMKEFEEQLDERVDAVSTYLRHVSEKGTPVERFFGPRYLAELRGEKIVQTIVREKGKFYSKLGSK